MLADGSEALFDIYEASVIWDGRPHLVPTDAADSEPLIGMTLLEEVLRHWMKSEVSLALGEE